MTKEALNFVSHLELQTDNERGFISLTSDKKSAALQQSQEELTVAAAILANNVQTFTKTSSNSNVIIRFGEIAFGIIPTSTSAMVQFGQGEIQLPILIFMPYQPITTLPIMLLNVDLISKVIQYCNKLAGYLHSLSITTLLTMESIIIYIIQKHSSFISSFFELFCGAI